LLVAVVVEVLIKVEFLVVAVVQVVIENHQVLFQVVTV
jgi:hypothetical protein